MVNFFEQLFGKRRFSLGNGNTVLLLIFLKEDREDPGHYRGITLLSVVGEVFHNNRLVQY